jgi:O-antigen/teichoic acid export membrane protein
MDTTETKHRHLRPDSLAASVTILLAANLVQRSIGFGRGILFCRWLNPDELGTWEMAYSFLLLAAPVVVLGLPGSFGRYLERYRQRGQLRTFLRRATIWTVILTAIACTAILCCGSQFSNLIFGRDDAAFLVLLVALSLIAVIAHHFMEAVFSALRKFSIVSTMHFCQSISFAIISLALMWCWQFSAASVIAGYGAACFLSVVVMLCWKGRAVIAEARPDGVVEHREFWPPLLKFAFWVWVANLCCQLFSVVDRYMLVHFSGLENNAALTLVGHYHASRIVPVLLISVAALLAGAVMPYLSHDWEAGARHRVSDRLNGVLKVTALTMLACGVGVLWIAPFLFHFAFQGRYDEGLAVMPWTLTNCVWYSLFLVAQNYVWCAERTRLATLPLVIGLIINVGIDLLLIPKWGLLGAAIGTTVATAVALAVLYWLNKFAGMKLQPGMLIFTAAPAAMCSGVWGATATLLLLIGAMPFSKTLLTNDERVAVVRLAADFVTRCRHYGRRQNDQPEPAHAIG